MRNDAVAARGASWVLLVVAACSSRVEIPIAEETFALEACSSDDAEPLFTLTAAETCDATAGAEERLLERLTWFFIPQSAEIASGRPSRRWATLGWSDAGGVETLCLYKEVGWRFRLSYCTTRAVFEAAVPGQSRPVRERPRGSSRDLHPARGPGLAGGRALVPAR